jgi:hypothetical protein
MLATRVSPVTTATTEAAAASEATIRAQQQVGA